MECVIIFGDIRLFQILVVFIAILAILLVFNRFHKKKTSITTFILWVVLWVLLAIFAIMPESSTYIANLIGIGRGLDLIIIFGIIGSYYLIFRIYLKLEKIDQDITKLVRIISIEKELNYELDQDQDQDENEDKK
ncbi:hypothetical protein MARBORIA2_19000 [Methanobrevibacter arboriphilus]|jgi:hypothetical protein|uniref:DUF2304 domain-containing protein n=1 Tax=Methanobrevibacter arboriphilus TaxID=39441 RepID=UPI0022EE347C|nr:DUF2304 family protein [Methanobrevibacter arboriphilus]GLI12810.1 hypothetical protein MARBORIA2_19000 [Methanobrevibacter arboriphilus]